MELPFHEPDRCESMLTANRSAVSTGQFVIETMKVGDFVYFERLNRGAGSVIPVGTVVKIKAIYQNPYFHIRSADGNAYFGHDIARDSWLNLNSILGQRLFITVAEAHRLSTPPEQRAGNFLIYKLRVLGFDEEGLVVQDLKDQSRIAWKYIFLPALTGRLFLWPPVNQGYPFGGVL